MTVPREIHLDLSEVEGVRRRKRGRHWSDEKKDKIRRQLMKEGFSTYERDLWIAEEIEPTSRVGVNLRWARKRKMRDYLGKGFRWDEAVTKSELDRIEGPKALGYPEDYAKRYLFGELYELNPDERKITGPIVR